MKKEIVILGTGVMMGRDFTTRSQTELAKATKILTIVREPPELWLPSALRMREVECLAHLYFNQQQRVDNYIRVARHIVELADSVGPVAFVTYGSPLVYDRVVSLTRALAEGRHIPCRVIPGVSAIDAIMAFLGEDIAPGLQICEARWLVANELAFDTKLPVLLFQVGFFWTDGMPSPKEVDPSRIGALKVYLLRRYPGHHYAVFVRAPSYEGDAGYMRATELRHLDCGEVNDLVNTSLYIPPLGYCADGPKFWHGKSHFDESIQDEIDWN